MLIPFGDDNPREKTPYVNYALLAINIGIGLLTGFSSFPVRESLGGLPVADPILAEYAVDPTNVTFKTLVTSMFLHSGFMHLGGNMLFLWIFGDNVEDALGHVRYAIFYFACGFFASFAHLVSVTEPVIVITASYSIPIYSLGASGAISGVIGAYVVFYPHNRIRTLFWLFFITIVHLPAWIYVGIYALLQFLQMAQGVQGVALWAHVGGLFAGVAVAFAFRAWWKVHRPVSRLKKEIWESSGIEPSRRRPFSPVAREQPDIEFIDASEDRYAVIKLTDDAHGAEAIAGVVSNVTGEVVHAAADRIASTRGMITRGVSRKQGEQIQRELRERGYATALVIDAPANHPPVPTLVEALTWNNDILRLRMGDQITTVPWADPFLYTAADVAGQRRIDVFINRRTAYRLPEGIRLTRVDSTQRTEVAAVPSDLARDILAFRGEATTGEGIRMMADGLALSFPAKEDYENYLFWIYTLALSRTQGELA